VRIQLDRESHERSTNRGLGRPARVAVRGEAVSGESEEAVMALHDYRRRKAIARRFNPNKASASFLFMQIGSFGGRLARTKRLSKLARLQELHERWLESGELASVELHDVFVGVDALVDSLESLLGRLKKARRRALVAP
jgi:hypothetical protein